MHVVLHYKPADLSVHRIDLGSHIKSLAFKPKEYQKAQMKPGRFNVDFDAKKMIQAFDSVRGVVLITINAVLSFKENNRYFHKTIYSFIQLKGLEHQP